MNTDITRPLTQDGTMESIAVLYVEMRTSHAIPPITRARDVNQKSFEKDRMAIEAAKSSVASSPGVLA